VELMSGSTLRLTLILLCVALAGVRTARADTYFILMSDPCPVTPPPNRETKPNRRLVFRDRMKCVERTQDKLRTWLRQNHIAVIRSLPIANALIVDANASFRDQICHVSKPWQCKVATTGLFLHPKVPHTVIPTPVRTPLPVEWSPTHTTVSVGFSDTGFNGDHPSLKDRYRGTRVPQSDPALNWLDAAGVAAGPACDKPCDEEGHGSGVVGEAMLDLPPGVPVVYFGCRDTKGIVGTDQDFVTCLNFLWAPADKRGDLHPEAGADVVNVSGGCDPAGSDVCAESVKRSLDTLIGAGAVVVASAGKLTESDGIITALPAIHTSVIAVGGTNDMGDRYPSSPVGSQDGCKPDVVARATGIEVPGNVGSAYQSTEGTSFASPQVAAAVAAVLADHLTWVGKREFTTNVILHSASPLEIAAPCTTTPPDKQVPNRVYGFGSVTVAGARAVANGSPPP
jgi:subtilisin family serine protease